MNKAKVFVGIDPGKNGALSIIDENNKIILKTVMPIVGGDFDKKLMLRLFLDISEQYDIIVCTIEKVQAMPITAKKACISIGYGFGLLEMCLIASEIPYQVVSPREWQKLIFKGIRSKDTKIASLTFCERMFPKADFRKSEKCKKFHDGITDSLCIAVHGRRLHVGEG